MRPVSTRVELRRDVGRVGPHEGPWIRRRQVGKVWGPADPAQLAELTDHRGQTLAWGLVAPDSEIPLRVVSFGAAAPPADWLLRRVEAALAGRAALGLRADGATSAWREINSEGDGLPGLTVDRYGEDTVLQIATAGMAARRDALVELFAARTPGRLFVVTPAQASEREGFTLTQQLHGEEARLEFREHGLKFVVPAPPAQKTGAYLDQRDNRRAIAELARVSGGALLDVGCHVGGFAIHAAALGVNTVGLDQSAKALECARENAASNGLAERCAWVQADMFAALEDPRLAGPFGVVVFDPPRIASSARDVERAAKAMAASLGRLLPRVQAGGFAVVCSCSQHLGVAVLDAVMLDARAGLWTRVLALGPGPDHPVWPGHDEGSYLRVHVYQRR
jgi:23S rRNA (cytosine1962-C5)-methyltransferase